MKINIADEVLSAFSKASNLTAEALKVERKMTEEEIEFHAVKVGKVIEDLIDKMELAANSRVIEALEKLKEATKTHFDIQKTYMDKLLYADRTPTPQA